ncbi:hypothetical protein BJV74DRAFT_859244 [Russula compacta]|nr:hypothetical protein BJV74DRAFT_859244 [Russula compacta]
MHCLALSKSLLGLGLGHAAQLWAPFHDSSVSRELPIAINSAGAGTLIRLYGAGLPKTLIRTLIVLTFTLIVTSSLSLTTETRVS